MQHRCTILQTYLQSSDNDIAVVPECVSNLTKLLYIQMKLAVIRKHGGMSILNFDVYYAVLWSFLKKKSGGRKVEGNLSPSTPNMLKNSEVEGVEGKIDINIKRASQSRKALFKLFEISKLLIQSLSNVNGTSHCTTYHRVVTDTKEIHHIIEIINHYTFV